MANKPSAKSDEQAAAIELMVRSAASMTSASMYGASLMTQAMGLWMGSVARTMEEMQAPRNASQGSVSVDGNPEDPSRRPKGRHFETSLEDAPPNAPKESRSARKREAASDVDDLKRIEGIGPKLEKVLNEAGIATYARIASLTADEIGDLERKLGLQGRIGRDRWVEKAQRLRKAG